MTLDRVSNRDIQNKLTDMNKMIANVNEDSPLDWRLEARDMYLTNQQHRGYQLDKTVYHGPSSEAKGDNQVQEGGSQY